MNRCTCANAPKAVWLLTLAVLISGAAAFPLHAQQSNTNPPQPAQQTGTPAAQQSGSRQSKDSGPTSGGASPATPVKGQAEGQGTAKQPVQQPKPAAAANPLILSNPADAGDSMGTGTGIKHDYSGLRPGSQTTSKNLKDYTHATGPAVVKAKKLKPFGYDYFKPARDTIDALRAYYQGKHVKASPSPSPTSASQLRKAAGADAGTIDSDSPALTVSTADETSGSSTLGSSIAAGAGALGAGGSDSPLGQGSILGAQGVSPVIGPQGGLPADKAVNHGKSGTDNSVITSPPPPGVSDASETIALPDASTPFDARTQVFGPIQGQFHNIVTNPPANYQLGPGDTITIQYSAPTMDAKTLRRVLDGTGRVNLQGLGMVSLVGKTIGDAESALALQFKRYFKGAQVTISLEQIHTVTVSVVGHAYEPGAYSVPAAIATAYNLLWWAGGPTEEGTLRDVEVRRRGKTIGTLDMYRYELGGGTADDIRLEDGDVVYIPGKLSSVAVQGEVRTQAIYELNPGETLQDAIRYTGGVKASAVAQRVQINTVDPGASRVLRDIDLGTPAGQKTPVFDGDMVEVLSVRTYLTNSVTIEGAVDQPSDYALTPNMRVSDLVNRSRGLLNEAYPIAELHHWNPDMTDTLVRIDLEKALAHDPANDLPLVRWDRIKVYTRAEVAWTGRHTITIDGQVQKQGVYTASKNMHVSDALRMAGGPLPNAYLDRAVLMHQHEDGPPTMEFVDIGAIINGNAAKDPLVLDNDHLAVYAVGQAQFTPDHIVFVKGEIVAPGPYPRAEDMTVTKLLAVAGGFKPDAGSMVVVTHARRVIDIQNANLVTSAIAFDASGHCPPGQDVKLEDGDVITIQGKGGFVDAVQTVTITGHVNNPGPIPITSGEMRLSDAISKAGGLRKEAYALGAEFHRDRGLMLTSTQQSMAISIGQIRDLINGTTYQRESAQSRVDALTATGQAAADQASSGLLGGLVGGSAAIPALAAGATLGNQINSSPVPVSPARPMGNGENEPDGTIAVNLPAALLRPGGHEDIILKNGDTIIIPETPTTVQVMGAVYHPSGVVWQPDKKIDYYLSRAGGMTFDAAKDGIEVIRAGGGIIPAKKAREILPGDVILVPTKPIAASIAKHSNAINDFFKSLTSAVLIYGIAKSIFGL